MRVGIHRGTRGFSDFILKYEKILQYNNIESIRLDAGEADFWEKVKTTDLFIYNWRVAHDDHQLAHTILPMVERQLKIPCFPNHRTSWCYDDKIREYYMLNLAGFPMTESWIFWDRPRALEWAKTASYPVVFKLKRGSSSHNVILVHSAGEAQKLIRRMFGKGLKTGSVTHADGKGLRRMARGLLNRLKGDDFSPFWQPDKNYAYFQRFLPGNDYDTRIVIIGDRAFGFRRYNRKNDFRASGSKNNVLTPEDVDLKFVELAFEISRQMGFQSMAYDFLYDPSGRPEIVEISYTFPDTTLSRCPGYWDRQLQWRPGRYWPQYCQLADLLNRPDLKQPDFGGGEDNPEAPE